MFKRIVNRLLSVFGYEVIQLRVKEHSYNHNECLLTDALGMDKDVLKALYNTAMDFGQRHSVARCRSLEVEIFQDLIEEPNLTNCEKAVILTAFTSVKDEAIEESPTLGSLVQGSSGIS